jgi:glucosamine--fructose-6-phosphate aminotransferase (isomerizing)
MCGIVGYAGRQQALPILLAGLRRLEYRGYDSAGVAVLDAGQVQVVRKAGKLNALEQALGSDTALEGASGIGHTRWATHGSPPTTTPIPTWTAAGGWR